MSAEVIESHRTPEGLYRFIVTRNDDDDLSLGFEGYPSHTHGDILAELSHLPLEEAVREYIDDLLEGRSCIAIARVGGKIRDVWVVTEPYVDKYLPADETLEFRDWDGQIAR